MTGIDVAALFAETKQAVGAIFGRIEVAEKEITLAQDANPQQADLLYHAFPLLTPTHRLMTTEFVYRGHVTELLARVAAGEDTRPGTAAEVCLAMSEMSLQAPLNGTGMGVYLSAWALAFPDTPIMDAAAGRLEHYQWTEGGEQIERAVRDARRRLAAAWRVLPKQITCEGKHWGEDVACAYSAEGRGVLF